MCSFWRDMYLVYLLTSYGDLILEERTFCELVFTKFIW